MKIVLHPMLRRKVNCIGIFGRFSPAMKSYIKQFPGVKWSSSEKCYYIPNTGSVLTNLNEYLLDGDYLVDTTAFGRMIKVDRRASKNR